MNIERLESVGGVPVAFETVRGIPELPVEPLPPGVSCRVASENARPLARLSLHIRDTLVGAPGRSGLVGHYEALDRDAGTALLRAACRELADLGVDRVLGPMNGSTWMRYRLALPSDPGDPSFEPPTFTAEPRNPFDYPEHFEAAGFRVAARYESRIEDLSRGVSDAPEIAARIAEHGLSLRPVDLANFEAELETLFALSLESFAENLYYSPIDEAGFRALYEPLRSRMDPEFVLIAQDRSGRACGYFFAFADPLDVLQGRTPRVIAKTIAVSPRARGQGLANHMLDRVRATALRRGHRELIHALMHVSNFSMRMSDRAGGRVFRRYGLWEWTP